MDITLKIGDKTFAINERQLSIYGIEFNGYQKDELNDIFEWKELTEKKVLDLCGYDFYVRDYQRGYRWTKSEIEALLNDIKEMCDVENGASTEKYCMQPLVIRKIENAEYSRRLSGEGMCQTEKPETITQVREVIDGQQRLTTIRLILNVAKSLGIDNYELDYKIHYEQLRNVDDQYFENAKNTITNWLETHRSESEKVIEKIKNNVFFVWYEIGNFSTKETSEEIFNNVNAGKVELTNAELFRALLLKSDNEFSAERKKQLEQIAFQWDEIEKQLQNDDFWYFIAGKKKTESTRIDYLLELFARNERYEQLKKIKEKEKNDNGKKKSEIESKINAELTEELRNNERFSFDVVKQLGKPAIDIWKEILKIYECLYSWFVDETLYHLIGFLVCCEEERKRKNITSDIVFELYNKKQSKNETKKWLWGKAYYAICAESKEKGNTAKNRIVDIEDLQYDVYTNEIIKLCLLFFNVWTSMQSDSGNRFSFAAYKNGKWDIEHINPQNLKLSIENKKEEEQIELVDYIKKYAEAIEKSDKALYDKLMEIINKEKDNGLEKQWSQCAGVINDLGINNNDISNLTLLNQNINRGYHNEFFAEKRKSIISNDELGVFIPPCTKNVFLKYYSTKNLEKMAWTEEDKRAYLSKLKECFIELKVKGEKSK